MTFKTGSWGEKAKNRSRRRLEYFREYRRKHPQVQINKITQYGIEKTSLGYRGEKFAVEFLKGSIWVKKQHDIEWLGYKIDVKTAKPKEEKTKRYGRFYPYKTWKFSIKRQVGKVDFFFLICKDDNEDIKKMYFIPDRKLKIKTTIKLGINYSKYDEFLVRKESEIKMSDIHIMEKGKPVNISEKVPGLKKLYVGMGWDVNEQGGAAYDLDLTAVLCDANKKVKDSSHVVYYADTNLQFSVGGEVVVQHSADNLTGAGDGDDEWMTIKLDKIPADIQHIFLIVNIYDAANKKQHFGNVNSSFVRLVNGDDDKEFARHELKNEFADKSGVVVAELYRMGNEWKANIIAKGVDGSIDAILKAEGLE